MDSVKRTIVVIVIMLSGVALSPLIGTSAEKFSWELYANLYITPIPIYAVDPDNGLNDTPVTIYIHGDNFSPGMSASLSDGSMFYPIEGLLFIDSTLLRGTIPVNTSPGTYDLILTDIYGGSGTLVDAYTSLDPTTSDDLFTLDKTDLWSDPPSIESGETVTLGLTIRRQGGAVDLVNVGVDFYLGAPGGTLIGRGTAPLITANGTAEATIPWVAPAPGQYTIYAVIDVSDDNIDNNTTIRTLMVVPAAVVAPPQIDSFSINNGAVDTIERQVYLNVSASSGATTPDHLLFVEYQYIQSRHDWIPVAVSGWLPYQDSSTDYAWTLQPGPGVHYLQVWAADNNRLVSIKPGVAFINYLPSEAHVATWEVHIYQYGLLTGESLLAQLTSFVGDADLYVFAPDGFYASSETSNLVEFVQYFANVDGIYQVEVEGFTSAEFGLDVILSGVKTQANGIQSPTPRGRGIPLTYTLPDEKIGLPDLPEVRIALPLVIR